MQKRFVNQRLIANSPFLSLSTRPLKRFRMHSDMDVLIFIRALWRSAARWSFDMKGFFDSLLEYLGFLGSDPTSSGKVKFLYFLRTSSFLYDWRAAH